MKISDEAIDRGCKIMLFVALMILIATMIAGRARAQTIVVQNMAPLERSAWATAAVPVDDAQLSGDWAATSSSDALVLLGARSGLKTRLVHVLVPSLQPFERRAISFRIVPREDVGQSGGGADPAPGASVPGDMAWPSVRIVVDGATREIPFSGFEAVENAGRMVLRSRFRLEPSMLVIEAWFYFYPESRVIPFEVLAVCSDPRTKAMRQDIEGLELLMPKAIVPVVRDGVALGAGQAVLEGERWRLPLLGATWFADSQGMAWSGALLLPEGASSVEAQSLAAELYGPVHAIGSPETWAGKWGPWGELPSAFPGSKTFPAYLDSSNEWVEWAAHPRPPWDAGPLQVKRPADTGDQFDFGVTKLSPALATKGGGPAHLAPALFRSLKTACRRGYYREADGSPVLAVSHPDLVTWGQPIHWHPGVSPDRLGKDPWVQQPDAHGWFGWDREHVSINELCGTQLLTGSHLLGELVRSNVESWLLGSTTREGWSTTSRGAPRSVGRTLLAMAWAYQCTGDPRIPERMRARLDSSFSDLLDPSNEAEVFVLGVHGKDDRKLGGKYRFWMPWQESLGVVGLDAAWRVTGDERFRELAERVAITCLFWGWWERSPGNWTVGDAIAVLEDGEPLDSWKYGDPEFTKDHSGTDFDQWALPAVKLAKAYADAKGEMVWQERALSILECLERRRAERGGPVFDRFGEWAAVK